RLRIVLPGSHSHREAGGGSRRDHRLAQRRASSEEARRSQCPGERGRTMTKILVGVDGSPESLQAALLSANLAPDTLRGLDRAHVLPDAAPQLPEGCSAELAVWRRDIAEKGTQLLHEVEERVARPDTEAHTVLVESARPAEALAELSREPGVELVVVGHRGRSAVMRALLGSVADRLVQISPKPVLVVR